MYQNFQSHPVGLDGQNHILAQTPIKLLSASDFENRRKSGNDDAETQEDESHNMTKPIMRSTEETNSKISPTTSQSSKSRPPKKTKRKPKYVIKW